MARVPSTQQVQANQIGATRTTLPEVTQFRGLEKPGQALEQAGGQIQGEADQLAALGTRIQLGDENRQIRSEVVGVRKIISDYTTGNPETNEPGWRSLSEQASVDASPAYAEKITKAIEERTKGLSGRVKDEVLLLARGYVDANTVARDTHNIEQRQKARVRLSKMELEQSRKELMNTPIGDFDGELGVVLGLRAVAEAAAADLGIVGDEAISVYVQGEETVAHEARIDQLLALGRGADAKEYFDDFESRLLSGKRADILKKVEAGETKQEAQAVRDNLLLDPTLDSEAKMQAALIAQTKDNPDAQAEARVLVSAHWATKRRSEQDEKVNTLENGNLAATEGTLLNLPPEEQEALKRAGGWDKLVKRNVDAIEGRALAVDGKLDDELWVKWTAGKLKDVDWSDAKYTAGFPKPELDMWKLRAHAQVGDTAKLAKASEKDRIALMNIGPAMTASKDLMKAWKLTDKEQAYVSRAVSIELRKLVEAGKTSFNSDEYQEIVTNALMSGEHKGGGFFHDPNITVAEAIALDLEFTGKDFVKANLPIIRNISKRLGMDEKVTAVLSGYISEKLHRIPSSASVLAEYNRRLATQNRAAVTVPGVGSEPAPAAAVEPPGIRPFKGGEFIQNPDGSKSTEVTITVDDPRLNGGRPTLIPQLYKEGGATVDLRGKPRAAIEAAIRSGVKYPSFATFEEADSFARERSSKGGALVTPLSEAKEAPNTPETPENPAPAAVAPAAAPAKAREVLGVPEEAAATPIVVELDAAVADAAEISAKASPAAKAMLDEVDARLARVVERGDEFTLDLIQRTIKQVEQETTAKATAAEQAELNKSAPSIARALKNVARAILNQQADTRVKLAKQSAERKGADAARKTQRAKEARQAYDAFRASYGLAASTPAPTPDAAQVAAPSRERFQLKEDEGLRRDVYPDTEGFLTVGRGHRLTPDELELYKEGDIISDDKQIEAWFQEDMKIAVAKTEALLPKNAPDELFDIVTNMVFNMGSGKDAVNSRADGLGGTVEKGTGVRGFAGMLKAIRAGDFELAAKEMEWVDPADHAKGNTKWYRQTKGRAIRLIKRMRKLANV